jgi:hypothetical protein
MLLVCLIYRGLAVLIAIIIENVYKFVKVTYFILLSLSVTPIFAQQKVENHSTHKHLSVLPVPTFGYTPETRFYFGAACLFSKKLDTGAIRWSNAKIEFSYTLRKQIIGEIGWNAYLPKESYFTSGKAHFSYFPDYFWGNSLALERENPLIFSTRRNTIEAQLLRRTGQKPLFLGLGIRGVRYASLKPLRGDSSLMAELSPVSAIGIPAPSLLYDSRNNPLNADSGFYSLFQAHPMLGTARFYIKSTLDVRKYFRIKRSAIALRSKTVYSSGPTLDAVAFGGDENARGFYQGILRAPFMSTLQVEWRLQLLKRWGWAFFAGESAIANQTRTLYAWNAGTGLRFLVDRQAHINLRMDMAWGQGGNSGFYVAFGESF